VYYLDNVFSRREHSTVLDINWIVNFEKPNGLSVFMITYNKSVELLSRINDLQIYILCGFTRDVFRLNVTEPQEALWCVTQTLILICDPLLLCEKKILQSILVSRVCVSVCVCVCLSVASLAFTILKQSLWNFHRWCESRTSRHSTNFIKIGFLKF